MDAAFQQLEPAQRSAFIQRYFMVSEGVDAVATDLKRSLSSPARTSLAAILRQVAEELLSDHKS